MFLYSLALLLGVLQLCSANDNFTDFVAISNPPQDFTVIELGPTCPSGANFSTILDIISFVVEPVKTSDVVIKTFPANLLDVFSADGVLRFHYNDVSSKLSNGTGVLVQVPESQLEGIRGAPQSSFRAWVLNGFTNLRSINQQGWDSQLVFDVDSSVGRLQVFHGGESNSIFLGHDVEVDLDVVGSSHSVTLNALLKTGTISASKTLLWTNGEVEQLAVTGVQNRVFVSSTNGCNNVDLQGDPATCEILSTIIRPPEMKPVSEATLFVTCPAVQPSTLAPTSAAAGKTFFHVVLAVTVGFAFIL